MHYSRYGAYTVLRYGYGVVCGNLFIFIARNTHADELSWNR